MAKVNLIFHGYLKELYPDGLTIDGETITEVINGLCRQTDQLKVRPGAEKHKLRLHGFDTEESLVAKLPEDFTELHIMPDLRGGKGGGFTQIIIGIVLVAIAVAIILVAPVFAATPLGAAIVSGLMGAGIGMLVGGLIQMLSPAPELDTTTFDQDPEASKYLLSQQNTTRIGTRIPIIYGKVLAHGHYLSFNVDAKDISV